MKSITTGIILLLAITTSSFAQSRSFQTIREKFSGSEDVHCFNTNGFFARAILWMANEHEFNGAIVDIKSINLITIPKSAFRSEGVTVSGFKKVLQEDSFEQLARVQDQGDDVTFYLRSTQNQNNRYIILVEEPNEVVVIEMRGYIDPNLLLNHKNAFSDNKQKS